MILRLQPTPEFRQELDGLILEETTYGAAPTRPAPAEVSLCLVLDGLLVESDGPDGTACPSPTVLVHPAGGTGLVRRSGGPGWARCFEMRLGGAWLSRLRDCGVTGSLPRFYVDAGRVNMLMAQIHVEVVRPAAASAMAIGGLTLTLLAELRRLIASGTEVRSMPGWLRRAVTMLHERFRAPMRMAAIAREVGVHPVHLSRGFRRAFGVTMTDYVRDLRIHYAAEALVASPDPVPRIARSAGYQNVGHFTRSFKRATGLTPAAYRGRSRQH